MAPPKNTAAVATYGDHEVIMPENKLRKAVSEQTALARRRRSGGARGKGAGRAVHANSPPGWIPNASGSTKPVIGVSKGGFTKANKEALFHAAHDIKGEAATFGFPAVAAAADSLCRLIEHTPDPTRIPIKLVDQHVDAVRAIYREYARSDAKDLAATLTERLREVTDEFLIHENRDRPGRARADHGPVDRAG